MKKLLLTLGIISVLPLGAFAFLYENETANVDTLEHQGFSQSTLEVVDWAKYRNSGKNSKYVRYYKQKNNGKLGRGYHTLKSYVDPIQDDGHFGDHQIEFSNTWMGDVTKYSSDYDKTGQVERL